MRISAHQEAFELHVPELMPIRFPGKVTAVIAGALPSKCKNGKRFRCWKYRRLFHLGKRPLSADQLLQRGFVLDQQRGATNLG